jgi:hypothetical protein
VAAEHSAFVDGQLGRAEIALEAGGLLELDAVVGR